MSLYSSKVSYRQEIEDRDAKKSKLYIWNPNHKLSIEKQKELLPIRYICKEILWTIENYNVTIILGETGSGKTTQIPQYLSSTSFIDKGMIICTQPKKMYAASIAKRVAEEMGVELGQEVGYTISFDSSFDSKRTRIKFLTDEILLQEMLGDPLLKKYSVIIVDESHERSISSDLLLSLLRRVLNKRPELRLVLSSATVDAHAFHDYFTTPDTTANSFTTPPTCRILSIPGRAHPVQIHWTTSPIKNYISASLETIIALHSTAPLPGDILVFLTGLDEIEELSSQLSQVLPPSETLIIPFFPGMSAFEQNQVFYRSKAGIRKIILATSIAETSITIEGLDYVIDCGFVKVKSYSPVTTTESLVCVPISKSSAAQRAGRAGRSQAGHVYRLYTKETFNELPFSNVPEIQRSFPARLILSLKALGIHNIVKWPYITAPSAESLVVALDWLYSLQALDDEAKLSRPIGTSMALLPLDPMSNKALIASQTYSCSSEVIDILAMIEANSKIPIFTKPSRSSGQTLRTCMSRFGVLEGDHFTFLNVWSNWQSSKRSKKWASRHSLSIQSLELAGRIRLYLRSHCKRLRIGLSSDPLAKEGIVKSFLSGFFLQAAKHMGNGVYKSLRSSGQQEFVIHPSSMLFHYPPKYVIYHRVIQTSRFYMRDLLSIPSEEDFVEMVPHYYHFHAPKRLTLTGVEPNLKN